MKAAIVILNYNGRRHLERFLPSVISHCPAWAEVIIADNASTDDSRDFLSENHPEIKTIVLDRNYGFAGGYNHALKQVDAEYYAILNSDVETTENWLDILVEGIEASDDIVAAQPKIRDYTHRDKFEYAGASGGFIDKYGYAFCRGRIFGNCERDITQHDDEREIFWATGACMVIKSKAFWEVEGFDEDLFAHMEEIDLCWRLKNKGYSIFCFPQSKVFHLGGGTLNAQSEHKTYLNFRNNLTVMVKNDYRSKFYTILFKRMILDGLAAFQIFAGRGPKHFVAVLKAHSYFYANLSKTKSKRKYWKARAGKINQTGFYRRSIVRDYYLEKKKVFSALPSRAFIRQDRRK